MEPTSVLLFFAAIVTIVYYYLIRPLNYWKKQGVKSAPGAIPGFGNILSVICLRKNLATVCRRVYENCSESTSIIGMFVMRTPMLMIREPDLIKQVLLKDFQCFLNNGLTLDEKLDPYLSKNPFFATNETWKEHRAHLVGNMSQKKLKILFEIMYQVSVKFDNYLERTVKKNEVKELEIKNILSKFTGELVANTAFGIEGHSLDDSADFENFTDLMDKLFEPSFATAVNQVLRFYLPNLASILGVSFMPKKVNDFFRDTVTNILHRRREKGDIVANDYMQMTIDGIETQDEKVIGGHISSFFLDAFETSATVAAFACYELSHHPDFQEKARVQINEVLNARKYEGKLVYDALKEMTYLDQIIYETVRLYPILRIMYRICTQKIILKGSDGQTCRVEPGQLLCIPVQSIHTDPKYWKNPTAFDPERFGDGRKDDVIKFTYLPFGEGPRMCAGMRYGVMTVKTIFVSILKKYIIESSNKTRKPIKFDEWNFLTAAKDGLWVKLRKINKD